MIIIVEGADNSGKSTLAQKLAEHFRLEVVHPGGPPKTVANIIGCMSEQIGAFRMSNIVSFVYDRVTCISDYVYRCDSRYDTIFKSFQEDLAFEPNIVIIYCRPSDEQLMNFDNHVTKEHEDEDVVERAKRNVRRTIERYDNLFDRFEDNHRLRIHRYNFENESFDSFIKRCFYMGVQ